MLLVYNNNGLKNRGDGIGFSHCEQGAHTSGTSLPSGLDPFGYISTQQKADILKKQ